jgi:peptide/nickel transport system substrate-binding protein
MPDAGVAISALAGGEIDLLESPSPDLLRTLEGNPDVKTVPNDPLGYQLFMVLNHQYPPFNNKLVRQALMWGTKQADYMSALAGDPKRWRECAAYFGCGTASESSAGSEAVTGFDLNKAQALLKQSGYKGEEVVLLDPSDNLILHSVALVAAQSLRKIGFKVRVDAMDWSTLTQRRASKEPPASGGWNAFITNGTVAGVSNPLTNIYVGNCEMAWYGWPCDKQVVELNRQWALETDSAQRSKLIDQIQARLADDVTNVPLGQYRPEIAFRKEISGVIASPSLFYWNIKKSGK